jgi:hypothetical protein
MDVMRIIDAGKLSGHHISNQCKSLRSLNLYAYSYAGACAIAKAIGDTRLAQVLR